MSFFDEVLAVNLRGYALCAQLAARQMIGRGGGAIVNVGSNTAATRPGRPGRLYRLEGRRGKPDAGDRRGTGRAPHPGQLRRARIYLYGALGHASGRNQAAALEERSPGQGIQPARTSARRRPFWPRRRPATSPGRPCWFRAASTSSWSRRTARCNKRSPMKKGRTRCDRSRSRLGNPLGVGRRADLVGQLLVLGRHQRASAAHLHARHGGGSRSSSTK